MATPPVDRNMLEASREAYLKLLELYRPLDEKIAADVPDWDQADQFRTHLTALCEDTALIMLGADSQLTEHEHEAFNTIFALRETREDVADMAQWLNQRDVTEEQLFSRLDRFMLTSSLVDKHLGGERTLEALAFFQSLGQVVALIDHRYHLREDMFYRALLNRIKQSWQQLDSFLAEHEHGLMLTLSDGSKRLYPLG